MSLPCGVHIVISQYLVHAPLLYSEEVSTTTELLKELTFSLGSIFMSIGQWASFLRESNFGFAILCMCVASFFSLQSQKEVCTKKVSMTDKRSFFNFGMLMLCDLCWSLEEVQLQVTTSHLLNPLGNKCFDENSQFHLLKAFCSAFTFLVRFLSSGKNYPSQF